MFVGGKSGNLARLRSQLPEAVLLPRSVALPFGTFERVLSEKVNQHTAGTVRDLSKTLDKAAAEGVPAELGKLREAVLKLQAPEELVKEVWTLSHPNISSCLLFENRKLHRKGRGK